MHTPTHAAPNVYVLADGGGNRCGRGLSPERCCRRSDVRLLALRIVSSTSNRRAHLLDLHFSPSCGRCDLEPADCEESRWWDPSPGKSLSGFKSPSSHSIIGRYYYRSGDSRQRGPVFSVERSSVRCRRMVRPLPKVSKNFFTDPRWLMAA